MKRDLTASSVRCRKNRILVSTMSSIVGITLVLSSLSWVEGSAEMRDPTTVRLLSIDPKPETEPKAMFELAIVPELFGGLARVELPTRQSEVGPQPILASSKRAIRLASMERDEPSKGRTRKS